LLYHYHHDTLRSGGRARGIDTAPVATMSAARHSAFARDPARAAGIALTLALHALALGVLLSYAPAREALKELAPVVVDLIRPSLPPPAPKVEPRVEPRVEPLPKPQPAKREPPRPTPPVLTAPATAPSPVEAPAPVEPRPAPPIEARPAPPAPPASPAPAAAPAAPPVAAVPAPLPVIPPDFKADYLDNPPPAYPPLARRMGEQGRVVLRVYVEASGQPSSVEVRTSSGFERLDQAALEAVRRWRFVPARQGERAVPAHVLVPISFNLKG
jgi:protein TonB